jgi:hypothetical protein
MTINLTGENEYIGLLTQFGDYGAHLLILLEIKMAIDS